MIKILLQYVHWLYMEFMIVYFIFKNTLIIENILRVNAIEIMAFYAVLINICRLFKKKKKKNIGIYSLV